MDQWNKDTANQTEPPVGTTITMANWEKCIARVLVFLPCSVRRHFALANLIKS
jgi:hypothetical protein